MRSIIINIIVIFTVFKTEGNPCRSRNLLVQSSQAAAKEMLHCVCVCVCLCSERFEIRASFVAGWWVKKKKKKQKLKKRERKVEKIGGWRLEKPLVVISPFFAFACEHVRRESKTHMRRHTGAKGAGPAGRWAGVATDNFDALIPEISINE